MSGNTETRKLAAIMFTDMVGYSALSQRNEALALELLEEHRGVLRGLFPKHQGTEIKTTGDGFLVEFASALAAVRCAVEIQRALAERNQVQPAERQVRIRIGIHLGDVVRSAGDVHGDGVNIAARIEPLAEPGGICISNSVYDQIENKVEHALVRLSRPELKNIQASVQVYKLVLDGSGAADGRRRTHAGSQPSASSPRRLQLALGVVALLVVGLLLVLKYGARPKPEGSATNPPPAASGAPSATDQKSIAVLAFANLSEDKGNETFSEGVSEELLNVLAKIPGLKVTARTSAFHFKGKDTPIPEIARQLGVAYVVEGSVRKADNRVRITAQLIKAADGFHVWSDTFTRDLKDIFAVQEEIAGLIAQQLQLKLGMSSRATQVVNPEAHRLVLEGRYFWNLRSEEGFARAEAAFKQALVIDPQFAPAHAGLALDYVIRGQYRVLDGISGGPEDWVLGRAEAQKAIGLDPLQAEPYAALAYAMANEGRWKDSEQLFQKAFTLNPNYAMAHFWHALVLASQGRLDLSLDEHRRASELDPLSFIIIDRSAEQLRFARRARDGTVGAGPPGRGHRVGANYPTGGDAAATVGVRRLRHLGAGTRGFETGGRRLRGGNHQIARGILCAGLCAGRFGPLCRGTPEPGAHATSDPPPLFWDALFDPWRDDPRFQQLLLKLNCAAEYQVARETLTRMLKEREAKK